jgi:hypothetical protein
MKIVDRWVHPGVPSDPSPWRLAIDGPSGRHGERRFLLLSVSGMAVGIIVRRFITFPECFVAQ